MDTIWHNGRINTLDWDGTVYSAVGAANGIVAALGSDEALRRLMKPETEVIDLKGESMFPGFMEAHNHLTIYGYLLDGIDLSASNAKKMDDILALVKERTETLPAGSWIKGSRYAEYFLAENRHPTRLDLDQVSPQHPVIIYHTSFHACVLNSMAIKMLGLSRETAAPQGGIIEKDPDTGDLTGVLHDQAQMDVFNKLFSDDLAAMTKQERIALCAGATESYAKLGFVFAADALVEPQTLGMYQDTLAAGKLKIRIYTMNVDDKAEPLIDSRIRTGFGSSRNTWKSRSRTRVFSGNSEILSTASSGSWAGCVFPSVGLINPSVTLQANSVYFRSAATRRISAATRLSSGETM